MQIADAIAQGLLGVLGLTRPDDQRSSPGGSAVDGRTGRSGSAAQIRR